MFMSFAIAISTYTWNVYVNTLQKNTLTDIILVYQTKVLFKYKSIILQNKILETIANIHLTAIIVV